MSYCGAHPWSEFQGLRTEAGRRVDPLVEPSCVNDCKAGWRDELANASWAGISQPAGGLGSPAHRSSRHLVGCLRTGRAVELGGLLAASGPRPGRPGRPLLGPHGGRAASAPGRHPHHRDPGRGGRGHDPAAFVRADIRGAFGRQPEQDCVRAQHRPGRSRGGQSAARPAVRPELEADSPERAGDHPGRRGTGCPAARLSGARRTAPAQPHPPAARAEQPDRLPARPVQPDGRLR